MNWAGIGMAIFVSGMILTLTALWMAVWDRQNEFFPWVLLVGLASLLLGYGLT